MSIYRGSASGPIVGRKAQISVPETPVAVTGSAVATAAFEGADPFATGRPGDTVAVSPRAALAGGIAIAAAWVSDENVISLKLINVGANATLAAQTMDAVIWTSVG